MVQCPNCGFENPDGSLRCAKCRTMINTSTIRSIIPPRSPFSLRKRRFRIFWGKSSYRTRLVSRRSLAIQTGTSFLVPGLGQFLIGEKLKGIALFVATVFFASLAYPFRGSLANIFLMIAFSFHGYSVSDCLRSLPEMRRLSVRLLVAFVVVITLSAYYRGAGRAFGMKNVFVTVATEQYQPALRRNDTVMVDRHIYRISQPQKGDIVNFSGPGGAALERIIGVPGDVVEIRNDELFVNSEKVDKKYYPLEKVALPNNYYQVVPEDMYLLLTTVHYLGTEHQNTHTLLPISKKTIIGKVILVWNPGFRRHAL